MADTPRGDPTAETLKRRALIRLAVAGVITLAALAGLWWLDKSGQPSPEPKRAPPAPIVTAPAPSPPPEPQATEPSPPAGPQATEPSPPATEAAARPQPLPAPPPPRVSNLTAPAQDTPPPGVRPSPATLRPTPKPEVKTEPAPPPPAPAPVGRGYVLQLGVFGNPDNAKQLVQRLQREGIRAWSETRVQVGPFQSREEAEKARIALEHLGIRAVIAPQGATR